MGKEWNCGYSGMNILVGNRAKQRIDEEEDDLRHGFESAGGASEDMKTEIRIKTLLFLNSSSV